MINKICVRLFFMTLLRIKENLNCQVIDAMRIKRTTRDQTGMKAIPFNQPTSHLYFFILNKNIKSNLNNSNLNEKF